MVSRRKVRGWIALLLPLMLLRAVLPPGYMPVANDGELRIVMCSVGLQLNSDAGASGGMRAESHGIYAFGYGSATNVHNAGDIRASAGSDGGFGYATGITSIGYGSGDNDATVTNIGSIDAEASATYAYAFGVLNLTRQRYGSAYLAKQVGQKIAREIFFLAREYDAQRAFEMGTVNAVVPHAELEETALDWAETILTKSPTAIRMLKYAMNLTDDGMVGQQVFAGEATRLAYGTDEAVEGRDAFLEKRDPDWSPYPYHF